MKVKFTVFLISFIVFSSCIKDYHGGGPKEIEFTEKNYLYEGALYKIYLQDEIETLDLKIQELKDIIGNNQGDENTQKNLEEATQRRNGLNDEVQV